MALTSGEKNKEVNGCSLLGIFLYILKHFPMQESVSVMNVKIRSTLALLKRMGMVQKLNDDEDEDELEIESTRKEEIETPPQASTTTTNQAPRPPKKIKKMLGSNKKGSKVEKKKKKSSGGKENCVNKPFVSHPKKLSPALAAICGGRKQMGRHEAVKAIWIYIKKHKLQDPNQRNVIVCDDKMKAVTKKNKVTCSEVLTYLSQHMTAI